MASGSEANIASSSMATQNIDMEQPVAGGTLPSKRDLTRAMACAMAISNRHKSVEYSEAFRKLKLEDQFQEIHLSDEFSEKQQFLVAYAEDAVFVGFRGSKVLQDFACDALVKKTNGQPIQGSFHNGVYQRSSCVFGPLGSKMFYPLLRLIVEGQGKLEGKGKRIIFCGHSLGGAVGHMVLIRLLLEKEECDPKNETFPLAVDNMISIAFGAPHLCDEIVADLINGNPNHKNRFITFVNQHDFVPRLLHKFPSIGSLNRISTFLKNAVNRFTNAECVVNAAGRVVNRVLIGQSEIYIPDPEDSIPDLSDGSIEHLMVDLVHEGRKGGNDYKAIGKYVFLESKDVRPALIDSTEIERIDGYLCKLPVVEQFNTACNQHRCKSYSNALVASSLILEPEITAVGKGPSNSSAQSPTNPNRSKPEVIKAELRKDDDHSIYNVLEVLSGKNLLFLREVIWNPIPNEKTKLEIDPSESAYDRLRCEIKPLSKKVQIALEKSEDLGTVTIKTAFGSCDFKIEKPPSVSEVSKLLPELVQRLGQMDSLGKKLTEEQQERLDNILRCHAPAHIWGRSYPDGTEEVMKMMPDTFAEARERIKSVEATVDFVQNSSLFKFQLQDGVSHPEAADYELFQIKIFSTKMTFSGTPNRFLLSYENTPPLVIGESGFKTLDKRLNRFRSFLGTLNSLDRIERKISFISTRWTFVVSIKNYEDMLQMAVRLIIDFNKRGNCNEGRKLTQRFTEDDLVKAVDGADENAKDWLRAAVSSSSTEVPRARSVLRLELPEGCFLRGATEDSIRTFFKKIYAIVETKKLYSELDIGGKYFVAVLGQEDSGKTAFIETVVGIKLPNVGVKEHTTEVKSYKAENGIILVDYPGVDGVEDYANWWKQFLALPTLIVLILTYEGDIKRYQVEHYRTILEGFPNRPILVAFNKVDRDINSRNKESVLKESFFEELKEKAIKKLGCSAETVFFTAFNPPKENLIYMEDLMKVGVLGHKAFMEKVNWLCPNSEHFES